MLMLPETRRVTALPRVPRPKPELVPELVPAAVPAAVPEPTLWGLDGRALHDQFWAAHGLQVVRRGADRPWASTVRRWLLIEPDELVLFDPAPIPRPPRHGVLSVDVLAADTDDYAEHVVADDSDRLVTIRRRYTPPDGRLSRVFLTGSARLAEIWRNARGRRVGEGDEYPIARES